MAGSKSQLSGPGFMAPLSDYLVKGKLHR